MPNKKNLNIGEDIIMTFDNFIIWLMAIGILLGAIDRLLKNKFGLGEKFEEGLNSMGPLALSMVGIVSLSPVISKILSPIIIPVYKLLGADPAMFASILANDMGGYQLALSLGENKEIALFSGLIVAAMLGCTIVFSIPVALGLIEDKDKEFFAKGLLIGLSTIPLGSIVGGLVMKINIKILLVNVIPIILISLLLILGLKFFQKTMIKGVLCFGKFILWLSTIGLAAAAFESLTGLVLIKGMAPIQEGMNVVINIGIVLLGTFPMLTLIIKVLDKPLRKIGKYIGLDATSIAGIIFSLANSIPVFKMLKDMNNRGKIINVAWLVSATSTLGAHLGFTAGVETKMIIPVIVSKLFAGVCAIVIALFFTRDKSKIQEY